MHAAEPARHLHRQPVAFLLHQGFHRRGDLAGQLGDAGVLAMHLHLDGLDLGDVEYAVDEVQQMAGVGLDLFQVGQHAVDAEVGEFLLQHLGVADDGAQGRAQFMAHVGDEQALGPVGLLRGEAGGLQLLLRPLARADVLHGADHAHRLSDGVAQDEAAVEDAGIAAVGAAEAVFVVPAGAAAVDHRMDAGHHMVLVVGVDVVHPPGGGGLRSILAIAEEGAHRLVPVDAVRRQVPVPDGVVGRLRRQPVTLLRLAQGLLGAPAGGDVGVDADPFLDGAVAVQQRDGAHQHVAVDAVVAPQPVFGLVDGPSRPCRAPRLRRVGAVVGMDGVDPAGALQLFETLAGEGAPARLRSGEAAGLRRAPDDGGRGLHQRAEPLLADAQTVFSPLAVGGVPGDADQAQAAFGRAVGHDTARHRPADLAGGQEDAELRVIFAAFPPGGLDDLPDAGLVVGMDAAGHVRSAERAVGRELCGEVEDFAQAGVGLDAILFQVPRPCADPCGVERQLQPPLSLHHAGFGPALLGHVGVGAQPAQNAPGGTAHRHGAGQEPAVLAVVPAQREGVLPGLSSPDGAEEAVGGAVDMVGVVDDAPVPAFRLARLCAGEVVPALIVPVDRAAGVGHPGQLRDQVGEAAELLLVLAQQSFRPLALRRVAGAVDGSAQ